MVIFPFLHKEAQKNLEYPGLYLEYPGNPEFRAYIRSFRVLAVRTIRTHIQSIRAPIEHITLLIVYLYCTYLSLIHICTICLDSFIMVLQR
jgi:hypothetical protein